MFKLRDAIRRLCLGVAVVCSGSLRAQESSLAEADRAASEIRANARVFVEAFNHGDAEALANAWTAGGEYIDESGNVYSGREAIAEGYRQYFSAYPGSKMQLTIDSVRMISESTAIEDGRAIVEPHPAGEPGTGRYTAVHVKSDGKWLIASLRDLHEPVPTTYHHLADLEWLIGHWTAEENGGRLEANCRWIANKSFVLREYQATLPSGARTSGLQVIGLNPASGNVQSWTFDSDGGHAVGAWSATADGWSIHVEGVSGDGTPTAATNLLQRLDDQAYAWKSVNRSAGGVPLPDAQEVILRRHAPAK